MPAPAALGNGKLSARMFKATGSNRLDSNRTLWNSLVPAIVFMVIWEEPQPWVPAE